MLIDPIQPAAHPTLQNSLPKVPAHLISLSGEHGLRMRIDAGGTGRLASGAIATVDLDAWRALRGVGVTPG